MRQGFPTGKNGDFLRLSRPPGAHVVREFLCVAVGGGDDDSLVDLAGCCHEGCSCCGDDADFPVGTDDGGLLVVWDGAQVVEQVFYLLVVRNVGEVGG